MEKIKTLLVVTLLTLIPAQLARLPFFTQGALTFTDFSVGFLDLFFIIYTLSIKKSLKVPKKLTPLFIFILAALISTIFALVRFSPGQVTIASLFLIRFILYSFLSVIVFNMIPKSKTENWLNLLLIIGLIFAVLGLVQFVIYPDLSFLTVYGWDPHQRRVIATFLDPNFTGGFLTLVFAISTSFYLANRKIRYLLFSLVFFLTIILTFSRSSYLAIALAILILGIVKNVKVLIVFLLIFLTSFIFIPKVRERIIGAISIDETSVSRIESWQKALSIFRTNPIVGVGFNTYRFAQEKYGYFSFDNPEGGHSGSGSDSSILLVLATTGILGLSFFLYLIFSLFKIFFESKSDILQPAAVSFFFALLIHSQFVNSFFYPQIMLPFWFIVGLALSDD